MEKDTSLQHLDDVLYQVSYIGMCFTDPWVPAPCATIAGKLGISIDIVEKCMEKLVEDGLVIRDRNGFAITKKGEGTEAHKRACRDEAHLRAECYGETQDFWLKQIQERINPF